MKGRKELLKNLPMKITEEMRREAEQMEESTDWRGRTHIHPKTPWLYRARKVGDALEIDLYTSWQIREGIKEPRYRVFLKDGKYDTFDRRTQKWRTATIDNLEYQEPGEDLWHTSGAVWIKEKERVLVETYTGNGRKDAKTAIQTWQKEEKHRRETDQIDGVMNLVPEEPKDFGDWIFREAADQYIFYDAGKKVREGYCTHCGKVVEVKNPRYNQEGTCPRCKHKIIYKSRKKSGWIREMGRVSLLQKIKGGYVQRVFRYIANYQNGIRGDTNCYWETGRQTYDERLRGRETYIYGRYKQTDKVRWCYDQRIYYRRMEIETECKALYWRNLKQVLKGSGMEYSSLWLFARHERNLYPDRMMFHYKDGVEKLIKCGFYSLARSCLHGSRIDYVETEENQCRKVLDLEGEYWKIARGKNLSLREYYMLHQAQECKLRMIWEDVRHLAAVCRERNVAIYIRHTTVHKMRRYIREVLKDDRNRFTEYYDYLRMAEGLGYDLNEEWNLFPRDMEERHRQLVEEKLERDERIRSMKDSEKTEEYRKTAKKKGWSWYEMETREHQIRLPESVQEIREEGKELHHCVATYIDRVVRGETCILLIREKTEPEKPFYTMEVKGTEVIQCRGKNNKGMTEEVAELVERFKKKKLRQAERMAG